MIRAPFAGYVSLRTISPGAVVTAGTPIVQSSDLSRIKLDFPIPETLLRSITVGQVIKAVAAAYPSEVFQGTIATIDPVVDAGSRSIAVRAILANADRRLRPGMLMTVAIQSRPRTALAVPEPSVVGEGDNRYVFVLGQGDKVARVPVKVGVRDAGLIEIVEGIEAGQKIVVEGVVKVSDGAKVRTEAAKPTGKTRG